MPADKSWQGVEKPSRRHREPLKRRGDPTSRREAPNVWIASSTFGLLAMTRAFFNGLS
jgi:hypothetical protein